LTTRTIEIIARTEDEARGIANGELNDNEIIVASETISAPARGLFGFVGKQEYKIRFTIGTKPVEVPKEIKEKKPQISAVKDEDFDAVADESAPVRGQRNFAPDSQAPNRGNRNNRNDRNDRNNRNNRNDRNDRNDRDARPRNPQRRPPRDYTADNEMGEEINTPERPKTEVSEEIKNHPGYQEIFALIKDVAANVGIDDLEMNDFQRDGAWVIEAAGENVSQLIGKRGRTLDSLQYLMNIIFNKGNEDRIKLVLDVQGYREKRFRNLILLANRMCRKAVSSRRQVELEPMSTLDRRTIHMALKDRKDIETFSKGMEPMRRVVISPVKKKAQNYNADWQPLAEDADSDFSEKFESSGSVPMFMEEDV